MMQHRQPPRSVRFDASAATATARDSGGAGGARGGAKGGGMLPYVLAVTVGGVLLWITTAPGGGGATTPAAAPGGGGVMAADGADSAASMAGAPPAAALLTGAAALITDQVAQAASSEAHRLRGALRNGTFLRSVIEDAAAGAGSAADVVGEDVASRAAAAARHTAATAAARAAADAAADAAGVPGHQRPVPLDTTTFILPDIPDGGPPPDYPPTRQMSEILEEWNPDKVEAIPNPFHETLAVFNYSDMRERKIAEKYRDAELPFKIYDIPNINSVVAKWSDDEYLVREIDHTSGVHYKIEQSKNNHFMYWTSKGPTYKHKYPDWKPPTKIIGSMSFREWMTQAKKHDEVGIDPETSHYYLMMGTSPLSSLNSQRRGSGSSWRGDPIQKHFVTRDISEFTPAKENFFVTNIKMNKGIQCRFGMRGVIAEAHYDGGRNMVAMLKGAKRYILAPPTSCPQLEILEDRDHPSFRHSVTDWSDPKDFYRAGYDRTVGIDTVVRTGEVLYIPSYWFHYIISLKYSAQCNTRSGSPPERQGERIIKDCMGQRNFKGAVPEAKAGGSGLPGGEKTEAHMNAKRAKREKKKEQEEKANRQAAFKAAAHVAKAEATR